MTPIAGAAIAVGMTRTLLTAAVLVVIAAPGRADPPAGHNESPYTNRVTVLLLDTLKIVEGDFGREPNGDYTLRAGRETRRFEAKSVLFAGDSRVAVNDYLTRRAKADAPTKETAVGLTDYNAEALRAYPSRIQPIVANLCANCHSRPDCPGAFKLVAITPGYADPAGATANLRATLALINRADPSASELLKMMVTRHGTQRAAAIPIPHHPALRHAELWAHWLALPSGTREPLAVPKHAGKATPMVAQASATTPAPLTNPHDPAAFNRAMHAGKR